MAGSKGSPYNRCMTDIYDFLAQINVGYKRFDHPAVFTCDEADKHWVNSQGAHTKNLFLRTKKPPFKYYLYILECSQRADLKELTKKLDLISRLTFAKDEELKAILDLTPGSVSPFGLINDKGHLVTVILDTRLSGYESLLFHPNTNTSTLEITSADFDKFLSGTGHTPLRA